MKSASMWFTKGLGLCPILCTVVIASAASGEAQMMLGGGNGRHAAFNGRQQAQNGDSDPPPHSGGLHERQGNQSKLLSGAFSNRNGVLQDGSTAPCEEPEETVDQDPMVPAGQEQDIAGGGSSSSARLALI